MSEIKVRRDIRQLSLLELTAYLEELGEKKYRAKQIYEWLWKSPAGSFEAMSNLSKELREKLIEAFTYHTLKLKVQQESNDHTIKAGFELYDNLMIEGVLIPSDSRVTACISSQVGCALNCAFCATGKLKFTRDLEASEIFDQAVLLEKLSVEKYGHSLDNIVLMGMGEPLLNYENVLAAIEKLTDPKGLNIASRRITLSTSGIADKIRVLADQQVKFNLAVSLHTADNLKRSAIMPVNKSNDLKALVSAIKYFHQKTGSRVTLEYLLLGGFNDTKEDAIKLASFCKNFPCKVNLIEYNPIDNSDFRKSSKESTDAFYSFLASKNMVVLVRRSRGKDIDAACGQLANKSGTVI
jgi:23S rRNA (adenine2503-C2)-methyltransferase